LVSQFLIFVKAEILEHLKDCVVAQLVLLEAQKDTAHKKFVGIFTIAFSTNFMILAIMV
jgi:hypothetical protein